MPSDNNAPAPDWKAIAAARKLDIPADAIERITPSMNALEAAFRPLVAKIPFDVEPAYVLMIEPEVKS
jgi:hypothetical protein